MDSCFTAPQAVPPNLVLGKRAPELLRVSTTAEQTETLGLNVILSVVFDNGNALVDYLELLPARAAMDSWEIEPDWMSDSGEGPDEQPPAYRSPPVESSHQVT